jgi:hypothetical protein
LPRHVKIPGSETTNICSILPVHSGFCLSNVFHLSVFPCAWCAAFEKLRLQLAMVSPFSLKEISDVLARFRRASLKGWQYALAKQEEVSV